MSDTTPTLPETPPTHRCRSGVVVYRMGTADRPTSRKVDTEELVLRCELGSHSTGDHLVVLDGKPMVLERTRTDVVLVDELEGTPDDLPEGADVALLHDPAVELEEAPNGEEP